MYTIRLNERESMEFRRNAILRQSCIGSADQQMASRLEAVEILTSDGKQVYQNTHYKGSVSDFEWHERQRG